MSSDSKITLVILPIMYASFVSEHWHLSTLLHAEANGEVVETDHQTMVQYLTLSFSIRRSKIWILRQFRRNIKS